MWSGVTDVDRLPSLCIPLLTTSLRSVRLSALHSPLIAGGAAPRAERSEEERSGGGMARTPRIHPAYRSYFLGSVVLSSHSPPVTPFRAHFVHSPLRAVGEWNETEDVSGERTVVTGWNGTWAADTVTRSRERRFQGPEVTDHKEEKDNKFKVLHGCNWRTWCSDKWSEWIQGINRGKTRGTSDEPDKRRYERE